MRDFDFPYAGPNKEIFSPRHYIPFWTTYNIQKKHNIKEFKTLLYTVL